MERNGQHINGFHNHGNGQPDRIKIIHSSKNGAKAAPTAKPGRPLGVYASPGTKSSPAVA